MNLVYLAPLVFALSALREGLGVFWVHFAERSNTMAPSNSNA